MARELISKNATKSVYRDGDMAIKVFCKGFPKAEVLNEALVSARIEEIGGINIPATLKVEVDDDGCWAITRNSSAVRHSNSLWMKIRTSWTSI